MPEASMTVESVSATVCLPLVVTPDSQRSMKLPVRFIQSRPDWSIHGHDVTYGHELLPLRQGDCLFEVHELVGGGHRDERARINPGASTSEAPAAELFVHRTCDTCNGRGSRGTQK